MSKKYFSSKKLNYKKRIKSNSNKHKTLKEVYYSKNKKSRKSTNNNSSSFFIIKKNKENIKRNLIKYNNKKIYTNYH